MDTYQSLCKRGKRGKYQPLSENKTINIAETFHELETELIELRTQLSSVAPLKTCVWVLPPTEAGNENLPINHIQPELRFSHAAVHIACSSFSDLHIRDGLSQKASRRTTGVLWYASNNEQFKQNIKVLVEGINKKKNAIQKYVTQNYIGRQRFQILHNTCPGVMTLHLYRQLRFWCDENIELVSFGWRQKSLFSTLNKAELLARMGIESDASADKATPMMQMIKQIINIPEERLRLRRPVKAQPTANIAIRRPDMPCLLYTNPSVNIEEFVYFCLNDSFQDKTIN
ncbi:DNA replication protein [Photorhabdus khanii]|uniref:DNA replication protein n=1 Tax=Photorhabdus khanii TaxID=1004150 RepID=A0A7C9LCZ9_9GAMM|nr:DNA replication terminus site-binding protein [Photorhabdus khanii]MQL49688.1 DNA replication protein [Photorhabdus khanii]